ncbi:MAG: FAD-dependent oxidoreductase [Anaerolineae bacterium]|nr:FAD-dependent oxidoreductase [Anaerolineae bacterium]
MADVIIVGGGLSGLAAAYALEQQHVSYTLIEVKGRLGGSISSQRRAGFVIDGGPFILYQSEAWPWLSDLGLEDAIYEIGRLPDGNRLIAFKDGTQSLVDALVQRLHSGQVMPRMSVSTLGLVEDQFTVCLENGMVIQAAALIIAAPARYAERMFYTFEPAISEKLLRFRYDTITRVSLGYRQGQVTIPLEPPPDAGFAFGYWTESETRVPPGHVLLQIGVRYPLPRTRPETLVAELQKDMGWPDPIVADTNYWPEAHCLNPHHHEHQAVMAAIDALLPAGVALIGSDYHGDRVEARMAQGRTAAEKVRTWLTR